MRKLNNRIFGISLFGLMLQWPINCALASNDAAGPSGALTIPLEPYLRYQSTLHASVGGQEGKFMFDTGEGVSTIGPTVLPKAGCHPWGRISGFRMSGERLDNPHCDNVTFVLSGRPFLAPVVTTVDIMKFMGPDVPPIDGVIGLDLFAGKAITIIPRRAIIVETPESLAERVKNESELPIRLVRDVEGIALSVDGAVKTPQGLAWMELDTGNGGNIVVANHIAPLLDLKPDMTNSAPAKFSLANGIEVSGNTRTRDLIMDGDISAPYLNNWILTFDLEHGRGWLAPVSKQ